MTLPDSTKPLRQYAIRIGDNEIRLGEGETLVGRDVTCEIVLAEGLVSRKHARLVCERGELSIEDLESANGTFVNRVRIRARTPLRSGDQVGLASTELEVLECGDGVASGPIGDDGERETPSSGVAVVARVTLSRISSQFIGAATERRAPRPTDALDAVESAARLANRMFALGRTASGQQLIAEPLEEILATARAGHIPSAEMTDAAGRAAIRLAQETLDGRWIDVAVEIHLIADRPFRAATLDQLAALKARAPIGDDALLARYYERLRSRAEHRDPEERRLCDRIATLVPHLSEDAEDGQ